MNVIKPARIRDYWTRYRRAKPSLMDWLVKTRAADWRTLVDVRATFPHADGVTVASGRTVVIFNIGGGSYRLITAIHYNRHNVYVLRFLTHADYDKKRWKDEL